MEEKNKVHVFGVGLPRTGSTSLKAALKILGFSKEEIHVGDHMCIPYNRYKKCDEIYPKGKFIFTKRESGEKWLTSVKSRTKVIGGNEQILRNREKMYGSRSVVPELYMPRYYMREVDIVEYFVSKYGRDVGGKLLVICFEANDGKSNWRQLCDFLGVDIPKVEFPHLNISK